MEFYRSEITPFTTTVIFFERSPDATAFVTSAMLRTCDVRLPAIEFTDSVRSFHVPDTPSTRAWPPRIPSVPTSRATRVTSDANERSWSTMVLMVFFNVRNTPLTSTSIFFDKSPFDFERHALAKATLRDRADHARHFSRRMHQVGDEGVDAIDRFTPKAPRLGEARALLELPFLADHLAQTREFVRHIRILLDHFVEGIGHFAGDAGPVHRQPDISLAFTQGIQRPEQRAPFFNGRRNSRIFKNSHTFLPELI